MRTMLAAALLALPAAAEAQDRPQIFPTRDVAVTFRSRNAGQAGESNDLDLLAALMRMNLPQGTAMCGGLPAQRGFMVMEQAAPSWDVPMGRRRLSAQPGNGRLTRGGNAKIAGID